MPGRPGCRTVIVDVTDGPASLVLSCSDYWDAEVSQALLGLGGGAAGRAQLGSAGFQAGLDALDLSTPAVDLGFFKPVLEVLDELGKAADLAGVDLEHGAADAPLTEPTPMFQQFMAGLGDWR
ncbi:hypothetical protein AB0H37_00205 [Actinomadura sp. NPDC023710]|uniref:hypothetical protein n=1 Tax=Actinomadura sp. NPDC023710 TaxID=3158219 RepID=UPI0033CBA9A5